MTERFRVGVVTSPHGIRGEAKVYPTSDNAERLKKIKNVYVSINGNETILNIESVKFYKNMAIVKFQGYDTPEAVSLLRNIDLFVDREHATPLKENENYIADLFDLNVIDETGKAIGKVIDVFPTGANHVMEVDTGDKKVLFPYIRQCILDVNLEEKYIKVHVLDGLMDL